MIKHLCLIGLLFFSTSAQTQKAKIGKSPSFSSGLRFVSSYSPNPSSPGIIVSDTFTQADGTTLAGRQADKGSTWTVQMGSFSTKNNRVYPGSQTSRAYNSAMSSADQFVEADFYFASILTSQISTIAARTLANGNSAYTFGWSTGSGQLIMQSYSGGTATQIGSAAFTPSVGSSYKLRLECQGSTIRGYLNGTLVITATSTVTTAANFAGLRNVQATSTATTGVHFGNFSAGSL